MNTDFAIGLYGLAPGANSQGKDSADRRAEDLETAARQFEALFIQDMLKSMRSAGFGGALGENEQTKLFRDLHDQQLATSLAESGTIGIAELVVRQLSGPERSEPGNLYSPQAGAQGTSGFPIENATRRIHSVDQPPGLGDEAVPGAIGNPGPMAMGHPDGDDSGAFADPAQFIKTLWSYAKEAGEALGLPPDVLLAQAALETGWGRHLPRDEDGRSSHNLFGIKAGGSWDGPRVTVRTLEFDEGVAQPTRAAFRAYGGFQESFQDYVSLLRGSSRYADAMQQVSDPPRFLESLQVAGYATDPRYAGKIQGILGGETMRDALQALKFQ